MLYDVFICHAGEDKDSFVRPLALKLRQHRVEVWYDEFSLVAGMSLRRSIDMGLARSRFGVVVLSPSFFGKNWPEWELSGLVQRHLSGSRNVLLPIWHDVTEQRVAAYSPPLADVFAIQSNLGLDEVARRLLEVLQPEGSALVVARDMLLARGYEPPVITEDWWLDVLEGAGWQHDRRWCFPVWRMTSDSASRGERLAWLAMQHLWQDAAQELPVTQMTQPSEVVAFICGQPGLLEVCRRMPDMLLEHAPQLAIPGFAGPLEPVIEEMYQASVQECARRRVAKDRFGTALTTDGASPECAECLALRHPTFGNCRSGLVACGFVQGHGAGFGPHTSAFGTVDYLLWLLSKKSDWLPRVHHAYLLQGMKEWAVWPWMGRESDSEYEGPQAGALWLLLMDSMRLRRFKLTPEATADLRDRIRHARTLPGLPESTEELVSRFLAERVIEEWFSAQRRRRQRQAAKPTRRRPANAT